MTTSSRKRKGAVVTIRRPAAVEGRYGVLSLEDIAKILSERTGHEVSYQGVRICHARALKKLKRALEPMIRELTEARDWPMPPGQLRKGP